MTKRLISVTGYVKKKKPKLASPYVFVDIPVEIDDLTSDDVAVVAEAAVEGWHSRVPVTLKVVEHEGRLWRPIVFRNTVQDGEPDGAAVLNRKGDNPLHAAAFSHWKQNVGAAPEISDAKFADEADTAMIADKVRVAARQVCLVDGVAYRTCEEPTWVVHRNAREIAVQPFFGKPASNANTAWFSCRRHDEAVAFAEELSLASGMPVVDSGSLEVDAFFEGNFDDVAFADDKIVKVFTSDVMLLWNALPAKAIELAGEARAAEDRETIVDTARRVAAELETCEGSPAVDALIAAAAMPMAQSDFFRRNAIFSIEDEAVLDHISFPKP